jgi:hypothetical protein
MRLTTLPAALLIAGCAALVPDTVRQLNGISPLSADPAAISAAIDLPAGITIPEGGATLFLGATRSDTGEEIGEGFALVSETDGSGRMMYAIAPADHAPLRALQADIAEWKAQSPEATKGTLSVAIAACSTGGRPARDATVSVFVSLEERGPLLPILRQAPVRAILAEPDEFGPCR